MELGLGWGQGLAGMVRTGVLGVCDVSSGAVWVLDLGDACTYFGVILIDILVVGHLHEAVAQVVVGEDQETGFQVTVNLFQILKEKQKSHLEHFQRVEIR